MKKIKSVLSVITAFLCVFVLCSCNTSNNKILKPQWTNIDLNNLQDGKYFVSFSKEDISEDKYLTFNIYSEDLYDSLELHNLQVGDIIEKNGILEKVEKIVWDEQNSVMCLNYWDSVDEADERFIPTNGGMYRISGPDDHSTYTLRGQTKLEIFEDCVAIDSSNLDEGPKVFDGIDEILYFIENGRDDFNCLNTDLRVENKKIVEINRHFIP